MSGIEGSKGLSGPDGFPTSIFWVPYNQSSFLKETRLVFLVFKKKTHHSHKRAINSLVILLALT